ncbi:polysaccharide deacetylase [Clostridium aestuarii]|uniref:Polysaccharide deacetylase n=1 Tax=Clostridium aestuarii TaxID=338193 RepID=A0ABT4D197_9CLOT|nr:polysaccharide deacetylase family protein [Clostridium aestuarii]MCY6484402.1 polysaccharide deacetylase [Clostridium aestuarii]
MKKLFSNVILTFLIIAQTFFIFIISNQYIYATTLEKKINDKKILLTNLNSKLTNNSSTKESLIKKLQSTENQKLKLSNENIKLKNKIFPHKSSTKFYIANMPSEKIAYLTFDDGPSKNTIKILNILSHYNVKATFFVTGSSSKSSIDIYKTIANKGHAIGNHTYTHDYSKIYKNVENFTKDFTKLQEHLKSSVGINPKIVRLPGGSNNTVSHKYGGNTVMNDITTYLIDNGYTYFDWNIDSTDASVKLQNKNKIVSSVLNNSKKKSAIIILMHDVSIKTTTVEALSEIIEGLLKQGFQFRVLSPNEYTTQFLRVK